jgi:predicted permease
MLEILLIILPIFTVMLLGNILYRYKYIDIQFINTGNRLLFNVLIPALLFYKISQSDLTKVFSINHVLVLLSSIALMFLLSFFIARLLGLTAPATSSFTANCFRPNMTLIGLPICFYVFGDQGLAIASIFAAFAVPVNNTLGVLAFSKFTLENWKYNLKNAIVNPLIVSCALAIPFAWLRIPLPLFVENTLSIISGITLPLALIGIGASISVQYLKGNTALIAINTLIKLFVLPLIGLLLFKLFHFGPIDIFQQIVILLLAMPSAQINFVFASAMNGDSDLSSGVIISTTLLSIVSLTVWLSLLI